MQKNTSKKEEIIGSETVMEKIRTKTPWIFGNSLRKPKINFPETKLPRISLPMPSRSLSIVAILVVLFLLQMGVVYLIVRNPSALGATQSGNPVFIYQGVHDSYIIESIVASVLILFCSIGFIMLYQASKYVYNKKMAWWILGIGLLMIVLTFILLQYMIGVKAGTI
ncbi:MAG: hypothetical protein R3255_06275 [Candidatus Lokiarchaeia archaeon]|nr:hypothetical protein [Candidatus Lokiarchaeia archaeon]